jgi:hypothetical protein
MNDPDTQSRQKITLTGAFGVFKRKKLTITALEQTNNSELFKKLELVHDE